GYADVRVRHVVDLLQSFPVPADLGGKPSHGNSLLLEAHAGRMALRRTFLGCLPLRSSVLAASESHAKADTEANRCGCGLDALDAYRRYLLAIGPRELSWV